MTVTVKHSDRDPITFTANMNLTGCTVRLVAATATGSAIVLSSSITDAVNGVVTHTLDGALPNGTYQVELVVTQAGVPITFPNAGYETLIVLPQLDGS